MENANSEQLNLAARLAVHRKVDFETALELVMTDPESANSALAPNKPAALRTPQASGLSNSEVKELLAEVYSRGRSDAEQDAKIEKLETALSSVDNRVNAIGQGFGSHLQQHAQWANDEILEIDPVKDLEAVLAVLDPKFRAEFLERLPEASKLALSAPKQVEDDANFVVVEGDKPKKRGLFS